MLAEGAFVLMIYTHYIDLRHTWTIQKSALLSAELFPLYGILVLASRARLSTRVDADCALSRMCPIFTGHFSCYLFAWPSL